MIKVKDKIGLPQYVKESIKALIENVIDKNIDVTIDKHHEKKTDPQRKYFWELVKLIREALKNGQTEQDIYCTLLHDYGISDWLAIPEDQIKVIKPYYRIIEEKGESTLTTPKGKVIEVKQLKCWKGLSEYNKEEACMLIDGAVEECKALGIPTDTPDELNRMKQEWGVDLG